MKSREQTVRLQIDFFGLDVCESNFFQSFAQEAFLSRMQYLQLGTGADW